MMHDRDIAGIVIELPGTEATGFSPVGHLTDQIMEGFFADAQSMGTAVIYALQREHATANAKGDRPGGSGKSSWSLVN